MLDGVMCGPCEYGYTCKETHYCVEIPGNDIDLLEEKSEEDGTSVDDAIVDDDLLSVDDAELDDTTDTTDTIDADNEIPDIDMAPNEHYLPCTGQTKCFDNANEMLCPDPENDFYGQDAQYATLGKCLPRSYVVSGTTPEEIVTDNNSGLTWQRVSSTNTYTWKGSITYCENLDYGGYNDWRLPAINELATLLDYDRSDPAMIDIAAFPDTQANYYWSTSRYIPSSTMYAWSVHFKYGTVSFIRNETAYPARCVRNAALSFGTFTEKTVLGDVIVTDTITGLQWTTYALSFYWQDALNYCEKLSYGGHDDWRLPNIGELRSLANWNKDLPQTVFPIMPIYTPLSFWSSTSMAHSFTQAWMVFFYYGVVDYREKDHDTAHVFCVR